MLLRWLNQYLVLISLLVILATFALAAENFLSFATFSAILNQLPALTLVTVGMTFVLICGGIDLSVGSVLALSSAVIGISVAAGFSIPVAALAGVTAGAVAGLVNGLLGSYLRLPVFIVTLGMLEAARGAAYLITDSQTVYIGSAIQGIVQPISWLGTYAGIFMRARGRGWSTFCAFLDGVWAPRDRCGYEPRGCAHLRDRPQANIADCIVFIWCSGWLGWFDECRLFGVNGSKCWIWT